ncbi:hypothetical protein LC728_05625 [Bacillus amyloliquefaciens]|uniref:hypothetical protein n=1 Tax=Bacillus amyloliquefaciens TaxID=1390 RepID=UPI001CD2D595|nr:hypothetical protein [Bacillus amyloliquefaciens]MCA1213861.1 hypothetical protein [Bacillus amyloliquefaciens]
MINREKEFRNAFYFMKRYVKSPLTPSYTRGYSAGLADKEPAKKIYDYILLLGNDSSKSFEEKVNLLVAYLEMAEQEEQGKHYMGTGFYRTLQSYIKRSRSNIEKGKPVQTRRY